MRVVGGMNFITLSQELRGENSHSLEEGRVRHKKLQLPWGIWTGEDVTGARVQGLGGRGGLAIVRVGVSIGRF